MSFTSKPLPANVLDIRRQFVQLWPVPTGTPGEQHEANVRAWNKRLIEEIVFNEPLADYGQKWTSSAAMPSKDCIAQLTRDGLIGWDHLTGVGTGQPTLVANPMSIDLKGQNFLPVKGVDHLGLGEDPGTTPPSGGDDDELESSVVRAFEALTMQVAKLGEKVDADGQRRYEDLVNHAKNIVAVIETQAPKSYSGELRIPLIGTVKLTLTPNK